MGVVVTTSVLMLTGCQSDTDAETRAQGTTAPSSSTRPTADATEAPSESPALVELEKRKDGTYDRGARGSISGIVSWEVLPNPQLNKDLTKPLGQRLGEKANAFLTDHYLREDRWTGSHAIKAGEMDALAEKISPALYNTVEKSVMFFDALRKRSGGDEKKWTAKEKKQVPAHARLIGHFILNGDTVDGGKGEIRNEITRKAVWIPTSGDNKALINTWVSIKTRRLNNTGAGKEIALWQAWKQVKGEWTIVDTGWKYV
jgi:hypothetical protein